MGRSQSVSRPGIHVPAKSVTLTSVVNRGVRFAVSADPVLDKPLALHRRAARFRRPVLKVFGRSRRPGVRRSGIENSSCTQFGNVLQRNSVFESAAAEPAHKFYRHRKGRIASDAKDVGELAGWRRTSHPVRPQEACDPSLRNGAGAQTQESEIHNPFSERGNPPPKSHLQIGFGVLPANSGPKTLQSRSATWSQ